MIAWNWIRLSLTVFVLSTTLRQINGRRTGNIVLEVSESVVKVNSTVVFTCRVQAAAGDVDISFVKAAKHDLDSYRDILTELIATGTSLRQPYIRLTRFQIERSTDGADVIFKLTIKDVQVEDTGIYLCSTADISDFGVKLLEVYNVAESIKFVDHTDSEEIDLLENVIPSNLTCTASNFAPHADLKVYVGDREVTDQFLTSSETNILCSNVGQNSKTCPLHIDYNMSVVAREFRPSYKDNGQKMTCSFTMRHFEKDVVNTSVLLNVRHPPRVICSNPIMVRINQTSVRVNCSIIANPPAARENMTWIINRGRSDEIRINAPSQSDEYQAIDNFADAGRTPFGVDATLIINKFIRSFLKNTYDLEVNNEVGKYNARLGFQELTDTGNTNGCRQQRPSLDVSLWTCLVALVSSSLIHRYL